MIFERVNGFFHAAFIKTAGDGAHKARGRQPAGATEARAGSSSQGIKRISATGTGGSVKGRKLSPAAIADWHRREPRQGGAAEGAGGGQESATCSVQGTSKHAGHGAPSRDRRGRGIERERTGVPAEGTPHNGSSRRRPNSLANSIDAGLAEKPEGTAESGIYEAAERR